MEPGSPAVVVGAGGRGGVHAGGVGEEHGPLERPGSAWCACSVWTEAPDGFVVLAGLAKGAADTGREVGDVSVGCRAAAPLPTSGLDVGSGE